MSVFYLALGTFFGFVLSRSGAADYDFIQGMFLFENVQLVAIMGAAVAILAPGLWLLKRRGRAVNGERLDIERKPFNRGTIAGSLIFGVGWSIAGMCPGPIFVNIGEGKVYAVATLAGALVGAGAFGTVYPRIQRLFRLPPVAARPPLATRPTTD